MPRLSARLAAAGDDEALIALGFRDDDREDVQRAIGAALRDEERMAEIGTLTARLRTSIGRFAAEPNAFDHPAATSEWRGVGVLPMLAMLAAADDVRAFHRSRGIPAEISDRSLSDLGQQAWVHRRTYDAFGVRTYRWLTTAFGGNLYWLGRLQFNLVRRPDGWTVSTHIPESGPLTPESVDDAFERAAGFFSRHFPDYPTHLFHCESWLLDPRLSDVLKPEANMVRFQRRWRLEAERARADADAIYFVFRRRADVDRASLPRETTLQRAVLDRLDAGGHWTSWSGTIEQAPFRSSPHSTPDQTPG